MLEHNIHWCGQIIWSIYKDCGLSLAARGEKLRALRYVGEERMPQRQIDIASWTADSGYKWTHGLLNRQSLWNHYSIDALFNRQRYKYNATKNMSNTIHVAPNIWEQHGWYFTIICCGRNTINFHGGDLISSKNFHPNKSKSKRYYIGCGPQGSAHMLQWTVSYIRSGTGFMPERLSV